jgi:hypothetical protein
MSMLDVSANFVLITRKLYHSIHARGERVEDVLREAQEQSEVVGKAMPINMSDLVSVAGQRHVAGNDSDELEDGELGESIEKEGENIGKVRLLSDAWACN